MRTLLKYAALGLAAASLVGCDSEQPAQSGGGASDAVLTIATSANNVFRANVWEIWEDTTFPPDGVPDRPKRQSEPNGPIFHRCDILSQSDLLVYPWGFSVDVSVLRAGSTTPQILSTTATLPDRFGAVTIIPPDLPPPEPLADFDNDADPTTNPPFATEYYRNGNKISLADPNFGLNCLQQVVDPNIGASLDNPGTIPMSKGDTIIVQARKAKENENPVLGGIFPNPELIGTITVGGLPVSLAGSSQSTADDGAGISFSFTLN